MQCPKCGNDMEECNGFFGTFYSCQICGATADPPNTPPFAERFQRAVESYCQICGEYRRRIDSSIFLGMNTEQGLSLLRDCEKKFTRDAEDYLRPMDKTLRKPAFMDARKVMNSETALVFARFAEACVQLNQFQEGKRYIDHALELADPIDESYQTIFATQSEINAHLNAIETSAPSNTLLLTSANSSPNIDEITPPSTTSESETTPSTSQFGKNTIPSQEQANEQTDIISHENATKSAFFSTLGLLSTYGRRRRLPYIGMNLLTWFSLMVVMMIFHNSITMIMLFMLFLCWVTIANVFKRTHDLGHPSIIAKIYIALFIINNILAVLFLIAPKLEILSSPITKLQSLICMGLGLYFCCKAGTSGQINTVLRQKN